MSNELPPLDEQTFKPPLTETEEIVAREKMPFVSWILDCRERQLSAALAENAESKRESDRLLELNRELVNTHNTHVILGARANDQIRALELQRDAFREALTVFVHLGQLHETPALGRIQRYAELLSRTDADWREMAEKEKGNG